MTCITGAKFIPITLKEIKSHELGIVVEGIAPTKEEAEEVTLIGTRQLFYARLPEVKGTAGTAAFIVDEVLPSTASYKWTMNHVIPVNDPMELFKLEMVVVGESIEIVIPFLINGSSLS